MIYSWKSIAVCYPNHGLTFIEGEISISTNFWLCFIIGGGQKAGINYQHEKGQIIERLKSVITVIQPGIRRMSRCFISPNVSSQSQENCVDSNLKNNRPSGKFTLSIYLFFDLSFIHFLIYFFSQVVFLNQLSYHIQISVVDDQIYYLLPRTLLERKKK